MAQPRLPDKQTKDAMLPGRCYENSPFKENIRKILRVNDEQLAVNRYRWYNLPPELSGNMIERILYYRGQAMLFYIPEMEKFYFLPYTLCGNLDIYGRYDRVKPLPFMGEDQIKKPMQQLLYLVLRIVNLCMISTIQLILRLSLRQSASC